MGSYITISSSLKFSKQIASVIFLNSFSYSYWISYYYFFFYYSFNNKFWLLSLFCCKFEATFFLINSYFRIKYYFALSLLISDCVIPVIFRWRAGNWFPLINIMHKNIEKPKSNKKHRPKLIKLQLKNILKK